ncbi:MAG: IscS subfamily cysteine desulfurase [Deltaproteobacteria bacterium]|nr:IscS subfamily cysteine desulfurase [Deltaproteobacteria bacterium]MBF0525705.1 IscS subfamily cysteine desulfurase [Deltaproteobacteria bacterium]
MCEVQPDEDSELGMICKIGRQSPQIVYSPDRLRHPLRRTGPKGRYEFTRITWDEAFDIIVARLNSIKETHGPEAAAIYTGRGSFEQSECDVFQPQGVAVSSASSVLFPFGSPNTLGVGALCYVSFAMIAPHVTAGGMLINMFSDLENADLIVIWGANPATDCPPLDFARIMKARQRGAEVVVIDPRRNGTAIAAEAEWIPIRPGTDGALALGMCQVLIEEELYDEHFVQDWTHGFDDFARYCQHFRPEVVEKITGVPAGTVRRLARRLASARGAAPVMYSGLEYSDSGVQAIRAAMTLWALAGQLDVPGGRCFTMRENQFPMNREGHLPNPDVRKALGRGRFPVYSAYRGESHAICLPDAVLHGKPYPIRSLIIEGGSIITAWPQPHIWRQTLAGLDFLVCIDRFLTADAAYADLVLPATTYYEIESYMVYGPLFKIRERVIEPEGEARHGFFILAELANRLGYGHLYPQSEEAVLRHALKPAGFTLEQVRAAGGLARVPTVMMEYRKWEKGRLRTDGRPGFETPTGKFEIASTILEEHGYDPLPVYTEPKEGPLARPDLTHQFPLVFSSGSRVTTDFRSQFHNVPNLVKEQPEPTVTMNSRDAGDRNIAFGDLVEVISPRGRVRFRAYVTDNIMPGVIDASMGGGGPVGPQAWQDSNVNDLTDLQRYDPISGFPVYKALLCQVVKLDQAVPVAIDGRSEIVQSPTPVTEVWPMAGAKRRIYLDHNATTPMDPEVAKTVAECAERCFGNPSSIHAPGNEARFKVESARRQVAQLLNCTARRIVFTGGGSEADNLAVKGAAFALRKVGNHIITTAIEHPAVLSTCMWLETQGFRITTLPVDRAGVVAVRDLEAALSSDTILVSIMAANNETGALQPIAELVQVTHRRGVLFHTDAVQAVGKIPIDVRDWGVDLLTLSGHKIHGPKGVGALYIGRGVRLDPLVHGGKQEHGLRAGTENVPGIVGLGKAAELAGQRLSDMDRVRALRDRLEAGIKTIVPDAQLNGPREQRLPNTVNLTLPGMRGESVVLALDHLGVALSSGSACRAGAPEPSHALLAMGLSAEEAHCTLRFSLGLGNTEEEIDRTLALLGEMIRETAAGVRFVPCR